MTGLKRKTVWWGCTPLDGDGLTHADFRMLVRFNEIGLFLTDEEQMPGPLWVKRVTDGPVRLSWNFQDFSAV